MQSGNGIHPPSIHFECKL